MHQTIMEDFGAYEEYPTPYFVVFILLLLHRVSRFSYLSPFFFFFSSSFSLSKSCRFSGEKDSHNFSQRQGSPPKNL